MSTDKIDPNKNSTEVLPKDATTELTDEELSKATGGGTATKSSNALAKGCAAGVHYTSAT